MGVPVSEVIFYTSEIRTNTPANGGRAGDPLALGAINNFFPVVLEQERLAGIIRYRKGHVRNMSSLNDPMHIPKLFMANPTFAGDNYRIAAGTPEGTQADIVADEPLWVGTGQLFAALVGAETSIDVTMEDDDFSWLPGEYLYLSNEYPKSQTIASDVRVGDTVQNTQADPANMDIGTWEKIAFSTDLVYPQGRYTGNAVLTLTPLQSREFIVIKDTSVSDEDIGTGDGISNTPALSPLSDAATGITPGDYRPVLTTLSGSATKTITIADDGTCEGDCSAGELNMADGTWTVNPVWSSTPDDTEDILISYARKPYSYAGNLATVELENGVQNAYPVAADCHVSHAVSQTIIENSWGEYSDTALSGSYDHASAPPELSCQGTVTDVWTYEFTNGSNFTCTGLKAGLIGSGDIASDFIPINPDSGTPYQTLRKEGWTGSFSVGETVTLKTYQSSMPFWIKETVPAGSDFSENNHVELEISYQ